MSLCRTHHPSFVFANGRDCARPPTPPPPPLFNPCKLASGTLFQTHHASIVFAKWGFAPPPIPPALFFFDQSCECCVCKWEGAAPPPPPRPLVKPCKAFFPSPSCSQMGGGGPPPQTPPPPPPPPRFILFRTHHACFVFARGCPPPPNLPAFQATMDPEPVQIVP